MDRPLDKLQLPTSQAPTVLGGARTLEQDADQSRDPSATISHPVGAQAGAASPVGSMLGRYENLGEIARGGMGIVYRVRDLDIGRVLALKVMLYYDAGPEYRRRFIAEARVTGQLQHPGVPPVHEIGELDDGRPYYTMKLIDGQTLSAMLAAREGPDHDQARFVSIFEAICQTIGYAHARGVVHRDLKPANIMVGAFGEIQVVDWGLAKVLGRPAEGIDLASVGLHPGESPEDDSMSRVGSVVGTPSYMPPEQARGEGYRVDERSDVFALGAMLCQILTGEPPYVDRPNCGTHHQAAAADLGPAMDRLDACGADEELIALARHCLEADRSSRPPDGEAVAVAVAAYQESMQDRLRSAELARVEADTRAVNERKRRRLAIAYLSTVAALIGLGTAGAAYVIHLQTLHRTELTRTVEFGLSRAEALARGAESGSSDDEAAWADAIAFVRGARAMLSDESGLSELRRTVETTLADIERRREGCRSLVPGCLAASNRYRTRVAVPPPLVNHKESGPGTPPDYSGISILRRSIFFDLSGWKRLPQGAQPATAGRVEPSNYTQVLDIVRKKNVTTGNDQLVFAYRTEGYEVDMRCANHPYTVRGPVEREGLGGGTRPVLRRELVIDISDCEPGEESRIVIQGTIWNGFQPNADGKVWAALLADDDLSEAEIAVHFAPGHRPKTPPTLYVFPRGSERKQAPHITQDFQDPLDRDWWLWRPRDVLRDSIYQIEWGWE